MPATEEERQQATIQYQTDLAQQTKSGSWEIGNDEKVKNQKVFAMTQDILPFDDIHKLSDCDLIYRFLIARKWNPEEAAKSLKEYIAYRQEKNLNNLLWEKFDPALEALIHFRGIDNNGRPVYLWRPDPAVISTAMKEHSRDILIRQYMKVIEQGRRIALSMGVDRVTCILDCANLSIGIVKNMSAVGLMKETSSTVSRYYVENLSQNLVINGGMTFSGIYAILKAVLDERVQKKIVNIGGPSYIKSEMPKYVQLEQIPPSFGGVGPEKERPFRALVECDALPPGSKPNFKFGEYKSCPLAESGQA